MIFVIFCAFLLGTTAGFPVICPRNSSRNARFIGSQKSDIQKAPYQVALLISHWQQFQSLVCGGALLQSNVIITAAYCTHGTTAAKWRVRAGSSNYNSDGQIVNVKAYVEHSNYVKHVRINDIALMFLSSSFSLGSSVKVINLPAKNLTVNSSTTATATGWGSPKVSIKSIAFNIIDKCLTENLQELNFTIIAIKDCSAAYPNKIITNGMLCGKRLNGPKNLFEKRKTTCRGDVGGPLKENKSGVLIGITSWGRGCADSNQPVVFTNVMTYMDWIQSNLSVM